MPAASILTIPPGPPLTYISSTAGEATVSWGATGAAGAAAVTAPRGTDHMVRVSGSTREAELSDTERTQRSYTFTGLDSGKTHTLQMRYRIGSEWSAWSEVNATTSAASTTLAAPASVSVSDIGANTAKVTWGGVSAATGFDLRIGTSPGGLTIRRGQGSTEVTIADLKPRTRYTVQVRSRKGTEASAWRSSTPFTTTAVPAPAKVSNLQVSARTRTSVTLSWGAYSGATEIVAMWLTDMPVLHNLSATATTMQFSGLSANTEYRFGVRARTSAGLSDTEFIDARTCAAAAPGRPTGLRTSSVSHNSALLSWSSDQCATGYEVKLGSGGRVVSRSTNDYPFHSLSSSTTHALYVRALNGSHRSGWSSTTVRTSAAPLTAPPAPRGLTLGTTSTSSIRLSWSAASRATAYDVRRGTGGTITPASSRYHIFSGLSANTSYTLYVRARNSAGNSGWSSITARTRLSAPTVTAGSISSGSARISWGAVSGAAGYDVIIRGISSTTLRYKNLSGLSANTTYVAYVRAKNGSRRSSWGYAVFRTLLPTPSISASVTSSSMTVSWPSVSGATGYRVRYTSSGSGTSPSSTRSDTRTGLSSYTSYTTHVRAIGRNNAVSSWTSITRRTRLATPTVSTGSTTSSSVKITWGGVSGANAYDVKRSPGGSTITLGNVSQYTFSGLNASTRYTFSVRAKRTTDSFVTSTWGTASATTSAPAPSCTTPSAPTSVSAQGASGTSITLSWTRSSSSGVDGYHVQRRTSSSSAWGSATAVSKTATSHTFTSLSRDTQYSMRIRAYDGTCTSAYVSATARTHIEGRIAIRIRVDGRLEVQFRIRGVSMPIEPYGRFANPANYMDRTTWLKSTGVLYNSATIGRIGILFMGDDKARHVEVGFFVQGGSTTRPILPTLRAFRYQNDNIVDDRWYNSSWFSFRPGASASGSSDAEDTEDVMAPALEDEPVVGDEEGGMLEAG